MFFGSLKGSHPMETEGSRGWEGWEGRCSSLAWGIHCSLPHVCGPCALQLCHLPLPTFPLLPWLISFCWPSVGSEAPSMSGYSRDTRGSALGHSRGSMQGHPHDPPEPAHAPPRCVCSRGLLGHPGMLKSVTRGELAISIIPRCHSGGSSRVWEGPMS